MPERMCREEENHRNHSSSIRRLERQDLEQAQAAKEVIIRQNYRESLCTSTGIWTESNTSIRCLYPNICSMGNKLDDLEICVQSQAFDCTVITETQWDSLHDWNVATKGYIMFRKDRPESHTGGISPCVRQHLGCIKLCLGLDNGQVESLWFG